MTAQQQQLLTDLTNLIEDISYIRHNIQPTVQAAFNALPDWVPDGAVNYARGKSNEAINGFHAEAGRVQKFCEDACNNIRECENIREAATAYTEIDFLPSMIATGTDTIAGAVTDGWRSPNTTDYLRRLDEMAKKVTRMQTSVRSLTNSLDQLADAMESRDVDLAITIAGIIVAVAGIIVALYTGITGVGAIIGFALAVIGVVITLVGLWRLTQTVPGRLEECRSEVRTNLFTVRNDPWPSPPRLTAADW